MPELPQICRPFGRARKTQTCRLCPSANVKIATMVKAASEDINHHSPTAVRDTVKSPDSILGVAV